MVPKSRSRIRRKDAGVLAGGVLELVGPSEEPEPELQIALQCRQTDSAHREQTKFGGVGSIGPVVLRLQTVWFDEVAERCYPRTSDASSTGFRVFVRDDLDLHLWERVGLEVGGKEGDVHHAFA